jgi:hypothetical protein
LDRPAGAESGGDATDNCCTRQHNPAGSPVTMPQQIDWPAPIGRSRPRDPQFRSAFTKFVDGLRQMFTIDSEEGIERLDFDVEPFHQRDGHRPQIRETATYGDLRDCVVVGANGPEKISELVEDAQRKIVPAWQCLCVEDGRHQGLFVPPRQLARTQQRAIANEGDARRRRVESNICLDRSRYRKCRPRSREAEKGIGWRDDRSNAHPGIKERPERCGHISAGGKREHDRLAIRAFDRGRCGRNIGQNAASVDAGRAD